MEPTPGFIKSWGNIILLFAQLLDEINASHRKLERQQLSEHGRKRIKEIAFNPFAAWLYELPTSAQAGVVATGFTPIILATFGISSLKLTKRYAQIKRIPVIAKLNRRITGFLVLPLLTVAHSNLDSLLIHHCTMGELMKRVRKDNDLDALTDMVGIDPQCLSAPTIAKHITEASYFGGHKSLEKIGQVLKQPPKSEDARDKARLHAALWLMWKTKQLDKLTPASAYEIFSERAGLYPKEKYAPGARAALWKYIYRFKTEHNAKIREEMSSPA